MFKHLLKKLVGAYQAKRLAKKSRTNAKHNLKVATDFYNYTKTLD